MNWITEAASIPGADARRDFVNSVVGMPDSSGALWAAGAAAAVWALGRGTTVNPAPSAVFDDWDDEEPEPSPTVVRVRWDQMTPLERRIVSRG